MTPIDITGQEFGRLTAIEIAPASHQRGKGTVWKFTCSCGNDTYAPVATVNAGRKKSCGCLPNEEKIPRPASLIPHRFWDKFLRNAAKRNVWVNVTAQDLEDYWVQQKGICALTGLRLTLPLTAADVRSSNYTASVDRIDSKLPYVAGNIQWVHKQVNMMKQDLSTEDFIDWCQKIVERSDELRLARS